MQIVKLCDHDRSQLTQCVSFIHSNIFINLLKENAQALSRSYTTVYTCVYSTQISTSINITSSFQLELHHRSYPAPSPPHRQFAPRTYYAECLQLYILLRMYRERKSVRLELFLGSATCRAAAMVLIEAVIY